jgi:hypothetical protein
MGATFNPSWRRGLTLIAIALASGGTGWVLGQREPEIRGPASADGVATRVATLPGAPKTRLPAITESWGDQAVSAHVVGDAKATAGDGASCEPAAEVTGVLDIALLERKMTEGTETERYAALTEALQSESDVPPPLLQQTYVTDLAESVRLLAFKAYIDAISDDRTEVRNTLESGVYDMSAAVQAESRRRLAELERYEVMLTTVPPQGY